MDWIINLFNLLFMGPIINLLVLIYQALSLMNIPGSLGFAIVFWSIILRFLMWPSMASQIKTTRKLAELKPHMDDLKKKHKDNRQALALAQAALYKEHGVNPAGGCLPALIQLPIFFALYQAIINILPGGSLDKINSLLYFQKLTSAPDPNFLGVSLGVKPSDFGSGGIYLLLIPVITGFLTFIQSKMAMPKVVKHYKTDSPKEEKEKEGFEESLTQVQGQMVYLMPIMFGYITFTLPVGLAIYWNAYTILGIIQQHRISGWGGVTDLVIRFKRKSAK